MAWRCSGPTSEALIHNMWSAGLIKTPRIRDAFLSVDRAHFCPSTSDAYQDSPQYLGYGATISAPHMHVHAIENLEPFLQPGNNVLDVGSGSGYLLALIHALITPTGHVLGIDHLPQLIDLSRTNLLKSPLTSTALSSTPPTLSLLCADGRLGSPSSQTPEGGWDAIHVGAAAPSMPQALVDQLKSPGRMFIPVGPEGGSQAVWQVDKDVNGTVTKKKLFGVSYVPLTDASRQHP